MGGPHITAGGSQEGCMAGGAEEMLTPTPVEGAQSAMED